MSGMADCCGDRGSLPFAGPSDVVQTRGYVPGYVREIASAILIGTCGRILLQQRDDVPWIRYPGLVALFGGHREGGESFLECATREVREEIGFPVAPARFEPLVRYQATYADGGGLIGEFFVV